MTRSSPGWEQCVWKEGNVLVWSFGLSELFQLTFFSASIQNVGEIDVFVSVCNVHMGGGEHLE